MSRAEKNGKLALNGKQSVAVKTAKFLQKLGLGGNYYFFESYVDEKGNRVFKDRFGNIQSAPYGLYYSDGDIYIDINAGTDSHSITLRTLSHELTHMIQQWSAAKYKVIADFLAEQYDKEGRNAYEAAKAKQADLSELRGKPVPFQEAYHEFVADSMSTLFDDGNLYDILTDLKKKDKTLVDYIKKFFDDLAAEVRKFYANTQAETDEGQFVQGLSKDTIYRLQQMFAAALVEASENYTSSEQKNTTQESGGVMYMSRGIGDVTQDTVRADLTDIFNGNNVTSVSYVPLTKSTPFAVRFITGYTADRPIIVEKKKAYFDMREDGIFKEDSSHHYHGMGIDGFLEAIGILNDPEYAVQELKPNGRVRYAFISTNEDGYEVCVVFEMDVFKPEYTMNGYPGGFYNLDITEFVATDEWMEAHGIEPGTAYVDYLLSLRGNSLAYDRRFHLNHLEEARAKELEEEQEKARNTDVGSAGVAASHINNRASKVTIAHPETAVKNESIRKTDYSNRELLAQALEGVATDVEDFHAVKEYRRIVPLLDAEEAKLSRLNAQIREMSFGQGKRDSKIKLILQAGSHVYFVPYFGKCCEKVLDFSILSCYNASV